MRACKQTTVYAIWVGRIEIRLGCDVLLLKPLRLLCGLERVVIDCEENGVDFIEDAMGDDLTKLLGSRLFDGLPGMSIEAGAGIEAPAVFLLTRRSLMLVSSAQVEEDMIRSATPVTLESSRWANAVT